MEQYLNAICIPSIGLDNLFDYNLFDQTNLFIHNLHFTF